jgi:hypothetical protein
MSNAQNLTEEIRALEAEFKAGNISGVELTELLQDLKHTKAISVAGDDLVLRSQFNQLINGIIATAGAV